MIAVPLSHARLNTGERDAVPTNEEAMIALRTLERQAALPAVQGGR